VQLFTSGGLGLGVVILVLVLRFGLVYITVRWWWTGWVIWVTIAQQPLSTFSIPQI